LLRFFREVGRENGETLRSSLGEGRFGDGLEGGVGEATRLRSAEGFREFERWFFWRGFWGFRGVEAKQKIVEGAGFFKC
jgi:hypothetical protein